MKSKFFGHALDEATAKTKNQHVIQYISYWSRGRVILKFWGIVPITAQDAKTIYEADKDSLLYLTNGDEVVLHKGHMGMGGDGVSVISGGITGVGARYKQNNSRVMMNHCACHKSSLSAADCAAGVPELAMSSTQKTCQIRGPLPLCQILFQQSRRKSVLHVKQMRWLSSMLSGIMKQTQM
jgi:hypothetical protein